jgi:hypothetical protein
MTMGFARVLVLTTIAFAAAPLVACEPWPDVVFSNETTDEIDVYQGDKWLFSIGPGGTQSIRPSKDDWVPEIRVQSPDGTTLLEQTVSYLDVADRDYRIVVACGATGPDRTTTPSDSPGSDPIDYPCFIR